MAEFSTMSRWSDQFQDHQIHQTVRQLKDWLDVEVEDIDSEHETERRRLSKVLNEIEASLSEIDPELFPEQPLANLNQKLRQDQVWTTLQNYSASLDVQQLRAANDHLTAQLPPILALLLSPRPTGSTAALQSLEQAFDKFSKAIAKREKEFAARLEAGERKSNEVEKFASEMSNALSKLKTETQAAFSEWQNEFTSGQTSRAEEFSNAQIDRGKKFDQALREWRDKSEGEIKSISSDHNEKLEVAINAFRKEIDAKLADASAKHTDILEIHGLVGTDGVAGGYQKNADEEHGAANRWRLVAMGSFAVAALWIVVKYFAGFDANADGSINWPQVVAASTLTVVLLGIGGYAAKQSGIHRETEQHMRWFALEVKAIDPFLSSLPEDKRDALKDKLTEKLFGQNRVTALGKEGSIDPGAFKLVTDAFQTILKAAGRG